MENWVGVTSGAILALVAIIGTVVAAQRYNTDKRSRIYERLDEHKEDLSTEMRRDYARQDMCKLTHQQNAQELKEIKAKTDLIPAIAAQVQLLVRGQKT